MGLRTTSWKIHSVIIIVSLAVTTLFLTVYAFSQGFPPYVQAILTSANFALNWTALAYAIYIYKLYDDAQTKTVKTLEGKGIKVKNIEEGLSELLEQGKKLQAWFETNKEDLQKIEAKVKTIDLGQMINSLEAMGNTVKSMQEHGFNQERIEKLFVVFEKVDLDKVIKTVDEWNRSSQLKQELENCKFDEPVENTPPPLKRKI